MKRYLKWGVIFILLFSAAWLVSSWYMAKQSSDAIEDWVSAWSSSSTRHIAELEVLESNSDLFTSQKTIRVRPSFPYLYEELGDFTLKVNQQSGPLLFSAQGIKLAWAEWVVTFDKGAVDGVPNDFPATLKILQNFSKQLSISAYAKQLETRLWSANEVALQGLLDLSEGGYQLQATADSIVIDAVDLYMTLPSPHLVIESQAAVAESVVGSFTKIALTSDKSQLLSAVNSEDISLNLAAYSSIWEINDTLDADFKLSLSSEPPISSTETTLSGQLRQWLLSGVISYLEKASHSVNFQRQAEWALEEVETQEQQDFYHELRYQSEVLDRLSWTSIIEPMLSAEKSQLAVNVDIDRSMNQLRDQLVRLRLGGMASGDDAKINLPLTGEMKITNYQLDQRIVGLLQRWAGDGSLREYEGAFESDLAVQNQNLLLNNGQVSLVNLMGELKQTLTDQ